MPLISRLFAALALACALPGLAQAQAPVACPAPAPGIVCFQFPAAPIVNWSWTPGIPPAALVAAVAQAKGGDTILLGPGPPVSVVLRNLSFSPPLTIASGDLAHPAVLNGLQLSSVSGLRLVNVDVHKAPANASDPVLFIQNGQDIVVVGANVSGAADAASGALFGKLISVAGGDHITITGGSAFDGFKGVSVSAVADFTLRGMDLHHIRTSPVDGGGLLVRPTIDGNHIHGIVPNPAFGDHSDGIHFFTKSGAPITDLTISNNLMEMGGTSAAGTLGINLEGTAAPGGFYNARVIGNTLRWNNNQGIALNYVLSGEISGNLLTPAPGLDDPKHAPSIIVKNRVVGPPSALKITGNTGKKIEALDPAYGTNTFWTDAQIARMGAASPSVLP